MTPTSMGPVDVQVAHLAWVVSYKVQVLGNQDLCELHWEIIQESPCQFPHTPIYQNNWRASPKQILSGYF